MKDWQRLPQNGNLKRQAGSHIVAAQNQSIKTNLVKSKTNRNERKTYHVDFVRKHMRVDLVASECSIVASGCTMLTKKV